MNIAIIGTGYVGLVTGTCFAESGNEVVCVDIDRARIARLNAGQVPIYEPGLEELVRRNMKEGRLMFDDRRRSDAVANSMITFITVGTPMDATGAADLSAVFKAAEAVASTISGYHIVVVKSTVPVGTGDKVEEIVARHASDGFDVCSVPEFLKEGSAIEDFMRPDRVVIGSHSEQADRDPAGTAFGLHTHRQSDSGDGPALRRDVQVRLQFDAGPAHFVHQRDRQFVRSGRRGNQSRPARAQHGPADWVASFLFPGIGYGGSCFPKDVQALIQTGRDYDLNFRLLEAAEDVNQRQKLLLVDRVKEHFGQDLKGRTLAIWGLAFKPRTDDMREAPSI